TLWLTPGGGVSDQMTEPSVAPLTVAVNCRNPFTRTVTADLGSRVTATAPSTGWYAERSESKAIADRTHLPAVMRGVKAIQRPMASAGARCGGSGPQTSRNRSIGARGPWPRVERVDRHW